MLWWNCGSLRTVCRSCSTECIPGVKLRFASLVLGQAHYWAILLALFCIFKIYFYFISMCMGVFLPVPHIHSCFLWRPEEGILFLRLELRLWCVLCCLGNWIWILQKSSRCSEPSLQPPPLCIFGIGLYYVALTGCCLIYNPGSPPTLGNPLASVSQCLDYQCVLPCLISLITLCNLSVCDACTLRVSAQSLYA